MKKIAGLILISVVTFFIMNAGCTKPHVQKYEQHPIHKGVLYPAILDSITIKIKLLVEAKNE
jgi:hypothetical protein